MDRPKESSQWNDLISISIRFPRGTSAVCHHAYHYRLLHFPRLFWNCIRDRKRRNYCDNNYIPSKPMRLQGLCDSCIDNKCHIKKKKSHILFRFPLSWFPFPDQKSVVRFRKVSRGNSRFTAFVPRPRRFSVPDLDRQKEKHALWKHVYLLPNHSAASKIDQVW